MCKKRRYRDEIGAKLALSKIQWSDKPSHTEKRVYFCPECKSWHLTSDRKKEKALYFNE